MSGTRLFFAVCLLLSALLIVTQLPVLQPMKAMPPAPAVGMGVWQARGCEGCHTLWGQGGAFAPDLTQIYEQRGGDYLREFLANPQAFHVGQRQMPSFGLTRSETDNLLAFLQWAGEQAAGSAWPPQAIVVSGGGGLSGSGVVDALPAVDLSDPVERGRLVFSQPPAICSTCHSLEADVTIVGPSLAGVATRAGERIPGESAEEYLRISIIKPGVYIVPGFEDVMQKNFGDVLTSEQINDLIAFLMTLTSEVEPG
ncbi:MAG: cytochrome c [Anaerolineae bacterium]|nr:cytochrome c [Anaerolineae bacterium]MBN8620585.1 cytochrome c [Anaerolineae bacterium]